MTGRQCMSAGHVVNRGRLHQVEVSSRAYVRQHPEDMKARLELAWCLLVEALYQAGRETSAPGDLLPTPDADRPWFTDARDESNNSHDNAELCRSDELFRECLHHAATVEQLSPNAEDHRSAKHLQSLIQLSGGENALAASQNQLLNRALAMFMALTRQAEDAV